MFELTRYSLTGECNLDSPQKLFCPKQINVLMGRSSYENGKRLLFIEKLFPNQKGVIEGSGFYDSNSEKADWVDDLLILIEEQRIGDEIFSMEEEYSESTFEMSDYEKEINQVFDESQKSVELTGKNNVLRIMQFNNESFIPYSKGKLKVTIQSNGNEIQRKFYDESYRLLKCENWNIQNNDNAELKETEEYTFNGDNFRPSKKTVTSDKDFSYIYYNEKGNPVKSEKYILLENKKEILVSVFEWKYNNENKISKEINNIYNYDKDYKKLKFVFEKKYIYKYNDFSKVLSEEDNDKIPPDFEYYEDNVLKKKNKYSDELGSYTSQVFFDNNLAVKTTYKKYIRIKDVYTVGDEVIRIKEYE